ncbi:MAG: hypothetical protein OXE58_03340 [Acidobacteria bacterium]|nr:hypothetical protein [Acidobacteriota bacterium]
MTAAQEGGADLIEPLPEEELPEEELPEAELSDEAEVPAGRAPGIFELGDFVFYPQIGHCDVGEVIHDAQTDLKLLELTPQDSSTGNRILVPLGQLAGRGIRHTGDSPGVIEEVLGSDFEPTIDDVAERLDRITAQEREGTVRSLALALKRLHFRHEEKIISREEERRRSRIRKWLVVEYMTEKEGTAGQAQSAITRLLSRTMKAVRERRLEDARRERQQQRAKRKADEAEKRARRRRA